MTYPGNATNANTSILQRIQNIVAVEMEDEKATTAHRTHHIMSTAFGVGQSPGSS